MQEFKIDVWNSLYLQGNYIAAELKTSNKGLRKWIAIYPLKSDKTSMYKFTVLQFELKEELTNEYFSEEDKLNQKRFYVKDKEELISLLGELNIPLINFTYPWRCDYPL
jgi:hypothetical protein